MKLRHLLRSLVVSLSAVQAANAGVINSADVNGLRTFTDTSTGRVWLDLNNFYDSTSSHGTTGLQMIALSQAAGFTFATKADVHHLLDTLPLSASMATSYKAVMGYGVPRNLMWAMYNDSNGSPYGYAYALDTSVNWAYADNATDASIVQNDGAAGAVDMGIWAYRTAATNVPEPGSVALLGLGLAGLVAGRRRKN